jgi:hypothetical protein
MNSIRTNAMSWAMLVSSALGFGALSLPKLNAQTHIAQFTVENPTGNTIQYQVKWGNEVWKSYAVQPHSNMRQWCPTNGRGEVGGPQLRFDYVCGDTNTTNKTFNIDFGWSPERFHYEFQYSADGKYLQLRKIPDAPASVPTPAIGHPID